MDLWKETEKRDIAVGQSAAKYVYAQKSHQVAITMALQWLETTFNHKWSWSEHVGDFRAKSAVLKIETDIWQNLKRLLTSGAECHSKERTAINQISASLPPENFST